MRIFTTAICVALAIVNLVYFIISWQAINLFAFIFLFSVIVYCVSTYNRIGWK